MPVLVNECYQLLCPTCVTPSVCLSVRLSRNSCSRKKPTICHETQEGPSICHETQEGPSTCHETQEGPSTCHETQGGSRTCHETQGGVNGVRCQSRASDHTDTPPLRARACASGGKSACDHNQLYLSARPSSLPRFLADLGAGPRTMAADH